MGDGTSDKFISKTFTYQVPRPSEPVNEIRVVGNNANTKIKRVEIEFSDNGEKRTLEDLHGFVDREQVKSVRLPLRGLRRVTVEAVSEHSRGGRGEFRVELGVIQD